MCLGKLRSMTSIYLVCDEKILLLKRIGSRIVKRGYISSAGGHFEKEELNDAKVCVLREMREEIGLTENDVINLQLKYVTLRLKDNEIRQNYFFFAGLDEKLNLQSNEGELEWISFGEVLNYEMPYTAKYVLNHYLETGRFTNELYSGIATENGCEFMELEEF